MGQRHNVINEQSIWARFAHDDAEDWWRQHPDAHFADFADWVELKYLPQMEAGMGFRRYATTEHMQQGLDEVHVGLTASLRLEETRREVRRQRRERAAA